MIAPLKSLAAAIAALGLCLSPTMAIAATTTGHSVSPLAAVSLFGTQASAQAVCSQSAASVAAESAAAAHSQAGCVLPAIDAPPPVVQASGPSAPLPGTNFGVNWLLLALGTMALVGGISTLFDDDDNVEVSPS